MRFLYLFLVLSCLSVSLCSEEDIYTQFTKFLIEHKRVYSAEEFQHRLEIFKQNVMEINQHNSDPSHTYQLGINSFSDMTTEEVKSMYGKGFVPLPEMTKKLSEYVSTKDHSLFPTSLKASSVSALPPSYDLRAKGVVSEIKNQLSCGGCWSFSATSVVETSWAMKTGILLDLSPQQMIDCVSILNGCMGCNGGVSQGAFIWAKSHGVCRWADYPYLAAPGTCKSCHTYANITGWGEVLPLSPTSLMQAMIDHGAISTSINADLPSFHKYKSGIYQDNTCKAGPLTNNHAISLVGYGSEMVNGTNVDYWILRNSWGAWGESNSGYMRIARGINQCGIENYPSYVTN